MNSSLLFCIVSALILSANGLGVEVRLSWWYERNISASWFSGWRCHRKTIGGCLADWGTPGGYVLWVSTPPLQCIGIENCTEKGISTKMCQTSDLIIVNFDALHWNNFFMTLKSSKRNWKTITFPFLSNKHTKKETKLIVGFIFVSLVSLTYSYFRFLRSKIYLYVLFFSGN